MGATLRIKLFLLFEIKNTSIFKGQQVKIYNELNPHSPISSHNKKETK